MKRALERALILSGLPGLLALRHAQDRLILAYHNVMPEGSRAWGERTLHIPARRFQDHLQVITRVAEVLPLDTLLEASSSQSRRLRVAITFDDGYRGAVSEGARMLDQLGLPATFFVNPGLGEAEGFWWDRLAASGPGALASETRQMCLTSLKGRQEAVLDWAQSEGISLPTAPEFAQPAPETELEPLLRSKRLDVQCHTWTHPNLAELSTPERTREFEDASQWLQRHSRQPPKLLSYPYGLDSPAVREDVRAFGFRWALRVSGGWLPRGNGDPFSVPRLNIPAGLSAEGLRLRLAGIGLA